jgi:serine/threonine protein kinase
MKLVFETGPCAGRKFSIEGIVAVGRAPNNDLVIDDEALSLMHCRLHVGEKAALVTDLGSTNGTWVNGERIVSCHLHDGDKVALGGSRGRVEVHYGAPQATIVTDPLTVVEEDGELSGNIFGSVTYALNRKIADGGMGSIYEAHQFGAEGFIKKVAIKTILPRYAEREDLISAFVGEARLVANLVHQNIVQIHHLGRHEGGYYIAMEYIDGITLTEFLSMHARLIRRVPIDIATFIVSRVARGMEYAHNKKDEKGRPLHLVHRDVSPNNIMIDIEGEVKLTDFGVAKAARFMEEEAGELVGCVEFMSPEQARCESVDGRSDIFSLGLVLYELLTGARVFPSQGSDVVEAIEAIEKIDVPDPRTYRRDLPDDLVAIVGRMLEKNRDERYQTAGCLSRALEEFLYGGGYGPTIVKLASYVEEIALALVTK